MEHMTTTAVCCGRGHLRTNIPPFSLHSIGGRLPDSSIQALTGLQSFDITDNEFNGSLPVFPAVLPFLSQALLGRNNLEGTVPIEWCRRFSATNTSVFLTVSMSDNPRVC